MKSGFSLLQTKLGLMICESGHIKEINQITHKSKCISRIHEQPCDERALKKFKKNIIQIKRTYQAQNKEKTLEKYFELKTIFEEASMNIREFLSNDVRFNKIIPDHDRASLNARKILRIISCNCKSFINDKTTHVGYQPRFITNLTSHMNFHIFTDATYATAIYTYREGMRKREPFLVYAKSRIAPIKGITIPRLELLAILIGV
uniref:Uncharacterized protein n=1 Tax=Dracunculus medinensis TaxID=318479 RepID=A0A0N4UCS8_DRAME